MKITPLLTLHMACSAIFGMAWGLTIVSPCWQAWAVAAVAYIGVGRAGNAIIDRYYDSRKAVREETWRLATERERAPSIN